MGYYLNPKRMWNNGLLGYVSVFWAMILISYYQEGVNLGLYSGYIRVPLGLY